MNKLLAALLLSLATLPAMAAYHQPAMSVDDASQTRFSAANTMIRHLVGQGYAVSILSAKGDKQHLLFSRQDANTGEMIHMEINKGILIFNGSQRFTDARVEDISESVAATADSLLNPV